MRERTFKGDKKQKKTKERERGEMRMNMWGVIEEREEEENRREKKGKSGIGKERMNIHERSNSLPHRNINPDIHKDGYLISPMTLKGHMS